MLLLLLGGSAVGGGQNQTVMWPRPASSHTHHKRTEPARPSQKPSQNQPDPDRSPSRTRTRLKLHLLPDWTRMWMFVILISLLDQNQAATVRMDLRIGLIRTWLDQWLVFVFEQLPGRHGDLQPVLQQQMAQTAVSLWTQKVLTVFWFWFLSADLKGGNRTRLKVFGDNVWGKT